MLARARPALTALALALLVSGLGHAVAQQTAATPPTPMLPPAPSALGAIVGPTGELVILNPADAAHDLTNWHPLTGDGSN